VPDIDNAEVVLFGPEERGSVEPLEPAENIARGETAVVSRWKVTPWLSWSRRMKFPRSGPRIFSIGTFSGATTCTSTLRARSEAATSRPMKLAPITTARRTVSALETSARLSASVRR
jgi:hypothetical protein